MTQIMNSRFQYLWKVMLCFLSQKGWSIQFEQIHMLFYTPPFFEPISNFSLILIIQYKNILKEPNSEFRLSWQLIINPRSTYFTKCSYWRSFLVPRILCNILFSFKQIKALSWNVAYLIKRCGMCSSTGLAMTVQTFERRRVSFYHKFHLPTVTLTRDLLFLWLFFLCNSSLCWIHLIVYYNQKILLKLPKSHLLYRSVFIKRYIFYSQLLSMGAACQKQFQNVPEQFPSSYEKQRERIQTNSIKLQHKLFKPNSKHITIGMIDTIIQSQMAHSKTKNNNHYSYDQSKTMSPIKTRMSSTLGNQKMENNQWGARYLDLEQLHATKRPFQGGDKVIIGASQRLVPRQEQKDRQLLDFTFYHSLGLPEYNYRNFPENVAKDYENLPVCEQEDRSGVKYIGQWSKDLKATHGNGVMQSNTTKYIGQFRNGLKHFHGRQIQRNEVYQGEFENGRRKGKGFRYIPGAYEEGEFNENLVNGKIVYEDESTYEGSLKNNKYHGKGVYSHKPSGIVQKGQFINGKLHGRGQITKQGCLVYDGYFQQDLKHGEGKYYWGPDHYYDGSYSRDKKHCKKGALYIGNTKYEGCFENGQMDGIIRVFQLRDNRWIERRKPLKFQNGIRSYLDEQNINSSIIGQRSSIQDRKSPIDDEPSVFSLDGMPAQWKETVKRKIV